MAKTDVIVDTSFLVAAWFEDDPRFAEASDWYRRSWDMPFVTTPIALCEMDYLLRKYGGAPGNRVVAANIATEALEVDWWDGAHQDVSKVMDARPDIGVADASLVALAAHRRTTNIATFDHRHFRTLKPLTGEPAFTLLP